MTEYYTVNEMYGEKFYQVPKVFFTNTLYKEGLTDTGKLAFGLLKDRFSLSVKNGWYDDRGRIYFIFTIEKLMEIFGCSNKTASNIKKSLVKVGLLEVKKNGQGNPDWLYLKKPIVTENDIYEIDKAETVEAVETCKNYTSKDVKNTRLEVQKVHANDTDLNDLDFKKTELKEEEEEAAAPSALTSFLLSKDITPDNAAIFERTLLKSDLSGYTNEDILVAIEMSVNDFLAGKCNEPYIWAVGKLQRLLDGKIKAIGRAKASGQPNTKASGKTRPAKENKGENASVAPANKTEWLERAVGVRETTGDVDKMSAAEKAEYFKEADALRKKLLAM